MKVQTLHKINNIIIVLIFSGAIFIPFSIGIIEKDKTLSKIEKRKLSEAPKAPKTTGDIQAFPQLFDDYYSDHFGLRTWFTKYYKMTKITIGDLSKNVTMGRNGWLFLGSLKGSDSKYQDPIGDVRNVNLYSQQDLKKFVEYIVGLKNWLKNKGIEYLFLIAPNKHTIYFDQLPEYITKASDKSATDQLIEYLKVNTDVAVVDLRGPLIREKDKYPLYYKTGTHWNFMGGNIAQYEILKVVKSMFPTKIYPELYDSSIFKYNVATDRGLESIAGIDINPPPDAPYPVFEPEGRPVSDYPKNANGVVDIGKATHTNVNLTQKLSAVVFRDSFFMVLEPFFNRKFRRSTYIWERLNYSSLEKYVALEKPDIVIEERVERSLPYVPQKIIEFERSHPKEMFDNSDVAIFSNDWRKLKLVQGLNLIGNKNNFMHLRVIGNSPIINFPLLPFQANHKYVLHIKMASSVHSSLHVYYSDANQTGYPFSGENSYRYSINEGDNDIYITLDYSLKKHISK